MDFSGQVVLVTGASRGIGRSIATAFADLGARVAVHYRSSREAADKFARALPGDGHRSFRADVADPVDCEKLVTDVVAEFGRLDVLVNNAGIYEIRPIAGLNYGDWQATWQNTLNTNLLGPANLCFLAARVMIEQGYGRIVNISSRGAFRGEPDAPAYGASKAGLNQLSQSLAQALAPHGISVAVVAPGYIETDMTTDILNSSEGRKIRAQSPLGRVGKPEEIAHAVICLASRDAEFATGAIVDVNGASYLRS